jgi:hypothetical protein
LAIPTIENLLEWCGLQIATAGVPTIENLLERHGLTSNWNSVAKKTTPAREPISRWRSSTMPTMYTPRKDESESDTGIKRCDWLPSMLRLLHSYMGRYLSIALPIEAHSCQSCCCLRHIVKSRIMYIYCSPRSGCRPIKGRCIMMGFPLSLFGALT